MSNNDFRFLLHDIEPMLISHQDEAKSLCKEKIDLFFDRFHIQMGEERLEMGLDVEQPLTQEDSDWMHMVLGQLSHDDIRTRTLPENLIVMTVWRRYLLPSTSAGSEEGKRLAAVLNRISSEKTPTIIRLMDADWRRLLADPPDMDNIEGFEESSFDRCITWWENQLNFEREEIGFQIHAGQIDATPMFGNIATDSLRVGRLRLRDVGLEDITEADGENVTQETRTLPYQRVPEPRTTTDY